MRVERMLQINVAFMAVFGTLLFSMGHPENSVKLPLMATFVALTSVIFTDGYGWFRLNRVVANLFAIVVAVYTYIKFDAAELAGDKLLEIANLLAYLQFILFYEEKSPRTYSHLMVLSLLQVVVAAALHLSLAAGLILVLYLLMATSTMMFFFLYREQNRVEIASGKIPPWHDARAAARKNNAGKRNFGSGPSNQHIQVSTDVQSTIARQLSWKGLLRQVAAMSSVAMLMSVILFYSMPRTEEAAWQGAPGAVASKVGFNDTVELAERDLITQSERAVMRVAFFDQETNKPYPIAGEPYFRGAVLYDYEDSVWQPMRGMTAPYEERVRTIRADHPGLVRQQILLEPYHSNRLFAVFPALRAKLADGSSSPDVAFYDDLRRRLVRSPRMSVAEGQYRYELYTTAFDKSEQIPVFPYARDRSRTTFVNAVTISQEMQRLRRIAASQFPTLVSTADQVLDEGQVDRLDRWAVAFALQDHFRTTEQYTYTLDFREVERDESLDPIEDFVKNHRTGHCEYFASALIMMLRSQGIPARMVVGYKGGDYNVLGDYYQVQEKYAHAWVEAYLHRAQLKESYNLPERDLYLGAWLRLDPTPLSSVSDAEEYSVTLMERVDEAFDYFSLLWADYVLGFNSKRQQESLYDPLNEDTQATISGMLDPRKLWNTADEESKSAAMTWIGWMSRILGVFVVVCSGVLVFNIFLAWLGLKKKKRSGRLAALLSRVVRLVAPGIAQWIYDPESSARQAHRRVSFYEHFVSLLARHDLHPDDHQTQLEFADAVSTQFAAQPDWQHLADLPHRIVDAFYQVRFGSGTLSSQETESIQKALAEMQVALSSH